jgi:phosphate transport system substrate-binding protein
MRIIAALFFVIYSTVAFAQTITGAGATFPFPVYSKWADAYLKETGVQINYQSVGSGAGIKQIQAKTVTFGASDMPLTQEQLDKDGLFQFPTVIGGIVISYNVEGVDNITLSGPVVADIYLGKIKKWNDQSIKALNPDKNLPNANISVVRRSDGSGTTFIFTEYLSSVSEQWKKEIGSGVSVEWPVGVGAKGNDGVAGNVGQTKNSIGYVEYAFAKQNKLRYASLNINQIAVVASKTSFQNKTWPITAPTYIVMYKNPVDLQAQKIALKFFEWAYNKGDEIADQLDYIPLSSEEKDRIIKGF